MYVCFHVREWVHVARLKIYLKTGAADGFPESPSDSTQLHYVGLLVQLNQLYWVWMWFLCPKCMWIYHKVYVWNISVIGISEKVNTLAQEDFSLLVPKSETIVNFSLHPTLSSPCNHLTTLIALHLMEKERQTLQFKPPPTTPIISN